MDEIEWWEFESVRELAEQAAGDIEFVIESAIEAHGGARIALAAAGDEVLEALLASRSDWTKVTIIPTDDRLVPLDHADSAYAKLQRLFGAKGADVVSLVDEAALNDYREAGRLADARLGLLQWPLDLVLLVADEEGRAAAFLPGPDLERAIAGPRERRAVGLRPEGSDNEDRVTLTAAALTSARAVMIVARGDRSRAALEQAIKEGPLSSYPIGRVLAEIDAPLDILWSAE